MMNAELKKRQYSVEKCAINAVEVNEIERFVNQGFMD